MFQNLSNRLFDPSSPDFTGVPGLIFTLHPAQLSAYLDAIWEAWRTSTVFPANAVRAVVPAMPALTPVSDSPETLQVLDDTRLEHELETKRSPGEGRRPLRETVDEILADLQNREPRQAFWHHLIYAYLIENTRIVEICARVVKEAVNGEKLRLTLDESMLWLRNTEELFFKESSPYYIGAITSGIRPDFRAVRRNAYHRMFGMDLNHGTEDNQPYPYVKSESANTDFVRVWRDFLREVWRGLTNRDNKTGQNNTDDEAINELAQRLGNMLQDRRGAGRRILAREEFASVAALSWFHLTVADDSAILIDLKANGTTPEERTRRLGEIVGLPANSRSRSFFKMADPMSRILHALEQKNFTQAGDFYLRDAAHEKDMVTLMAQWSIATGDDIKSVLVTAGAR
jgi:hypothetical protein